MDRLRTVNGALKTMQKRVGDFMGEIGAKCEGKLRAMARDGRRDVVITGIKIRRGEEGGEVHEERTKIELTVGSLNGLVAIRHGVGQEIFGRINAVVRAYETAEGLEDHARGRDLENLSVTLSDVDRIIEDANQLLTTEEIFFSNDFSALPFLIGETSERVKVARSLLKVGKQKAKEWLQAKDAALRSAYGVNKLEW